MKNHFASLIFFLLIASCGKEYQEPTISPYWGEVTVEKNDVLWKGKPYAAVNKKFSDRLDIIIDSLDENGLVWEALSFYKVPSRSGTYRIFDTTSQEQDSLVGSRFYYVEVDILYGVYIVLEADSSSFITLTSYDTVSKEVKGTFDVTFIKGVKPYPDAPDTIRLRNGNFHTKVIK